MEFVDDDGDDGDDCDDVDVDDDDGGGGGGGVDVDDDGGGDGDGGDGDGDGDDYISLTILILSSLVKSSSNVSQWQEHFCTGIGLDAAQASLLVVLYVGGLHSFLFYLTCFSEIALDFWTPHCWDLTEAAAPLAATSLASQL